MHSVVHAVYFKSLLQLAVAAAQVSFIPGRTCGGNYGGFPLAVHISCMVPETSFITIQTQRYVRIYNLAKQELSKKLLTGVKWVSSMDVHPGGDNIIIGSYDRRLCWFDLDLSTKPYKTLRCVLCAYARLSIWWVSRDTGEWDKDGNMQLFAAAVSFWSFGATRGRYHDKALRAVAYHARYPLFASASDDGSVHVFHGRVFSDLLQNPLIVPVKKLIGHDIVKDIGTRLHACMVYCAAMCLVFAMVLGRPRVK